MKQHPAVQQQGQSEVYLYKVRAGGGSKNFDHKQAAYLARGRPPFRLGAFNLCWTFLGKVAELIDTLNRVEVVLRQAGNANLSPNAPQLRAPLKRPEISVRAMPLAA